MSQLQNIHKMNQPETAAKTEAPAPQAPTKAKRSRRRRTFHDKDFKREVVYKFVNNVLTKKQITKQYGVENYLIDRWTKAFKDDPLLAKFADVKAYVANKPLITKDVKPKEADDVVTQLKAKLYDEMMARKELEKRLSGRAHDRRSLPAIQVAQ